MKGNAFLSWFFRHQRQNRVDTKSRWLRWGRGETLAFRRSRKKSTWYITGTPTCSCSPAAVHFTCHYYTWHSIGISVYWIIYCLNCIPLSAWSTGASADTRQRQRASAGEHHQWLWPGAFQKSPGPRIWRSGKWLFLYTKIISYKYQLMYKLNRSRNNDWGSNLRCSSVKPYLLWC